MKRFILGLLLVLALGQVAQGQFVTVTAVVTDVSGNVYSNCFGNADFVPAPTATKVPTLSGSTFQTSVRISACDSFGAFTLVLADNNLISDGHSGAASQWRISLCSNTTPPVCFNAVLTITGATQNISAALQAASAPLSASPKTLLNAQANLAPITGNSGNQVFYTYTLPANKVGNLNGFRIRVSWTHSTGSANVVYVPVLNGQGISSGFSSSSAGATVIYDATILNTGPTTGTVTYQVVANQVITQEQAFTLTGLAWGSSQILQITFNVANTDAITPIQWIVEAIQ